MTPEYLLIGFFVNGVHLNNKTQLYGPGHGSEGNNCIFHLSLIYTLNSYKYA